MITPNLIGAVEFDSSAVTIQSAFGIASLMKTATGEITVTLAEAAEAPNAFLEVLSLDASLNAGGVVGANNTQWDISIKDLAGLAADGRVLVKVWRNEEPTTTLPPFT